MEGTRDDPPAQTHVKQNNYKRNSSFFDSDDLQNYFKIRAIVGRFRPHFMEALQTPDFRNCKAADDIRKDLKQVLDLYKQMILQTDAPVNLATEQQILLNENGFREEAPQEGEEAPESLKTKHSEEKSTDMKCSMPYSSSERKPNGVQLRGSYVVGGSVYGKNFITYRGSKPVYVGPRKDSYLGRQMKS